MEIEKTREDKRLAEIEQQQRLEREKEERARKEREEEGFQCLRREEEEKILKGSISNKYTLL